MAKTPKKSEESKKLGRKKKESGITLEKFKPEFISQLKREYGDSYSAHREDPDINEFPDNSRYTKAFIQSSAKHMEDKFGGKKLIPRYKPDFLQHLKSHFGDKFLDYVENRCILKITDKFPDKTRYTDERNSNRDDNYKHLKKTRKSGKDKIIEATQSTQKHFEQLSGLPGFLNLAENILVCRECKKTTKKNDETDLCCENSTKGSLLRALGEIVTYLDTLEVCGWCNGSYKTVLNHFNNCLYKPENKKKENGKRSKILLENTRQFIADLKEKLGTSVEKQLSILPERSKTDVAFPIINDLLSNSLSYYNQHNNQTSSLNDPIVTDEYYLLNQSTRPIEISNQTFQVDSDNIVSSNNQTSDEQIDTNQNLQINDLVFDLNQQTKENIQENDIISEQINHSSYEEPMINDNDDDHIMRNNKSPLFWQTNSDPSQNNLMHLQNTENQGVNFSNLSDLPSDNVNSCRPSVVAILNNQSLVCPNLSYLQLEVNENQALNAKPVSPATPITSSINRFIEFYSENYMNCNIQVNSEDVSTSNNGFNYGTNRNNLPNDLFNGMNGNFIIDPNVISNKEYSSLSVNTQQFVREASTVNNCINEAHSNNAIIQENDIADEQINHSSCEEPMNFDDDDDDDHIMRSNKNPMFCQTNTDPSQNNLMHLQNTENQGVNFSNSSDLPSDNDNSCRPSVVAILNNQPLDCEIFTESYEGIEEKIRFIEYFTKNHMCTDTYIPIFPD